jgi:hypothetical protein
MSLRSFREGRRQVPTRNFSECAALADDRFEAVGAVIRHGLSSFESPAWRVNSLLPICPEPGAHSSLLAKLWSTGE